MGPDVSVIIPVYNAVHYAPDAIESVQSQTLDASRIEILVVDDGSTDGSGEVLTRFAIDDPRITVISQENSGTPGGGRNPAIGRATGRYIFFLDSDDRLTPRALERMVEVADAEESDVVLGKMGSDDGRRSATSTFKRTTLDATLVEDRIFNSLNPMKLIRRDVIERLDLRFPEDLRVGEDQPFMAAVYLNARKVSVLADMVYCIIRYRDDGANVTTLTHLDSAAHVEVAVRVAEVIEKYSDPGDLRDGLMRRPVSYSMARALDRRWLGARRSQQIALADSFRTRAGHLCTDAVRRALNIDTRVKLTLLLAGDLDGLDAYIDHVSAATEQTVQWDGKAFHVQLPGDLAKLVPKEELVVPTPKMTCRLEDVHVRGTAVSVAATVSVASFQGAPDELLIRARKRKDDSVVDFATTTIDLTPGSGPFAVTAEHADLDLGVWDVYVVVRFGKEERELRLGSSRLRTLEPEGRSNAHESPAPQDSVLAYFTAGASNLSIDRGSVLHKNVAVAKMIGITVDENGRALALVHTTREPLPTDDYFATIQGVRLHGGRHLLPSVRLGKQLIGLRLPLEPSMVGARLTISAVLGGMPVPVPAESLEYWSARAGGFGLSATEDGALVVEEPTRTGHAPLYRPPRISTPAETRQEDTSRTNAKARLKAAPVIGPLLVRARGAVRGRRP